MLLIILEFTAVKLSPVTFKLFVANHAKLLAMLEVKLKFKGVPAQIAAVVPDVIDGNGLTVTVNACAGPKHRPSEDVGIIVYVTFCAVNVFCVRVLLITDTF